MRLVGPWIAAFLAACFFTAPALARGKANASKPAAAKVASQSSKKTKAKKSPAKPKRTAKSPKILALSIGYPNDGKLEGARRFRETRHMKSLPDYAKGQAKWALPELFEVLDRAAQAVARRYPGSVLGVADFSSKEGGPIPRHRSHQTGRDVDVGFYLVSGTGRAMRPYGLVDMKADGTSTVRATTRFDEKRNWTFVAALLQDKKVKVTNIFIWAPLRARLLAHAEKIGAPRALRQKAAQVMSQPANVQRHADHFHIRIACPDGLVGKGCVEHARRRPAPVVAEPSKASPSPLGNPSPEGLFGDDDEDFETPAPAPRRSKPSPEPSDSPGIEAAPPAEPSPESPAPKSKPSPAREPELPPLPKSDPEPEPEPSSKPSPVAEPKREVAPKEPVSPPSADSVEEAKG